MDIGRLPVFAWFHFLWDPALGWYAHRTEANDGIPEEPEAEADSAARGESEIPVESTVDPEVTLWYECLEEARRTNLPREVVADPLVVEEIWQRQKTVASESAAGGINEIWSHFQIREDLYGQYTHCIDYSTGSQESEERYAHLQNVLTDRY